MKTVPSGRSDFCIKAAPAVSGTCMIGTPTPASVGRPESCTMPSGFATVGKAVLVVGLAPVEVCELWAALDWGAALDRAGALDDAPCPSGAESVARSGRPSCARTEGATAKSRPARANEGRIAEVVCVRRRRRMGTKVGSQVGDGAGKCSMSWWSGVSEDGGRGSRRKNNEGTDDDGTTTKGGDETSENTSRVERAGGATGCWRKTGMQGGGVEDLVGKWAIKSERAGSSAWCLAA
jgi:hypothetical protein